MVEVVSRIFCILIPLFAEPQCSQFFYFEPKIILKLIHRISKSWWSLSKITLAGGVGDATNPNILVPLGKFRSTSISFCIFCNVFEPLGKLQNVNCLLLVLGLVFSSKGWSFLHYPDTWRMWKAIPFVMQYDPPTIKRKRVHLQLKSLESVP